MLEDVVTSFNREPKKVLLRQEACPVRAEKVLDGVFQELLEIIAGLACMFCLEAAIQVECHVEFSYVDIGLIILV